MITVGEVLKKQRQNLEKSIEQVALDTKIQPRFIQYIEDDDFDKFDSPVYAQGFIKIYAKYLELNEDRILAIYRRSEPNIEVKNKSFRETENVKRKSIKITPKFVAIALSAMFLLIILSYIGYQIYQFQSPPPITISSPLDEESVAKEEITIIGATDNNSSIFINDQPVETGAQGNFQHQILLNPGVNIVTILAKRNNSTQESVETLKIVYEAPEESEDVTEESVAEQPNIVRLEIVNSSVWVQFNVDKINKLSQIVQAGETYEYEVTNEFSLTTGIINSTKLFFNEEEIPINRGSSSVGSVNCEIVDKNQINCQ
jgi:cytoskeletal protein RodZ